MPPRLIRIRSLDQLRLQAPMTEFGMPTGDLSAFVGASLGLD